MAARQDQTVVPTDTNVTSAGCDGAAQVDGTVNMEHRCMYVYVCVCACVCMCMWVPCLTRCRVFGLRTLYCPCRLIDSICVFSSAMPADLQSTISSSFLFCFILLSSYSSSYVALVLILFLFACGELERATMPSFDMCQLLPWPLHLRHLTTPYNTSIL